jgi:hypothetical protein
MEIEIGSGSTIFFVVFGVVAAGILYKVIRHGGFKGAMFGAPVSHQIGEMEFGRRGLINTKVKVHVLSPHDPGAGPHVGIEVIHSTIGSWEMKPVALTRGEAKQLAEELLRAADASERTKSGVAG